MRYLSKNLVTAETVYKHTHANSLENNKKVNIKGKVILSCELLLAG